LEYVKPEDRTRSQRSVTRYRTRAVVYFFVYEYVIASWEPWYCTGKLFFTFCGTKGPPTHDATARHVRLRAKLRRDTSAALQKMRLACVGCGMSVLPDLKPNETASSFTQNLRRMLEGEFSMSLPFVALCEVGPPFIRMHLASCRCSTAWAMQPLIATWWMLDAGE